MADDQILVERRGQVLKVTLNNPDRLNALSRGMQERLESVWRNFDEDTELRVALLSAVGERAFCAGVDLTDWTESGAPPHEIRAGQRGKEAYLKFTPLRLPTWKPVIAAVNGLCTGAGLHLVHDADVVIASENAEFFDSHLAAGQVSAGEPLGLTERLPMGVVLSMVLLGKAYRLGAARALELGLVTEVVPPEQLASRARELAEIICRQAPQATELSKRAIYASRDLALSDASALAAHIAQSHWGSAEAVEGARAFKEHRPPSWVRP